MCVRVFVVLMLLLCEMDDGCDILVWARMAALSLPPAPAHVFFFFKNRQFKNITLKTRRRNIYLSPEIYISLYLSISEAKTFHYRAFSAII